MGRFREDFGRTLGGLWERLDNYFGIWDDFGIGLTCEGLRRLNDFFNIAMTYEVLWEDFVKTL